MIKKLNSKIMKFITSTPRDYNELFQKMAIVVIMAMLALLALKVVDGDRHRLGTIQFNITQVIKS